jgi:hypothetical protein
MIKGSNDPAEENRPSGAEAAKSNFTNENAAEDRAKAARLQVPFLRKRLARSIETGDDQHAEIIRQLLDRVLNGDPNNSNMRASR